MLKVSTSQSPQSTNVLFHTVTAVSSQHYDAMHTSATKGPFKNIFIQFVFFYINSEYWKTCYMLYYIYLEYLIQQENIKLTRSDSKDIYNVVKYFI